MNSMRKKIPKFSSEAEERDFWGRQDSTEYIDWSKGAQVTLPKLRPTLRTISIRLPETLAAVFASSSTVTYCGQPMLTAPFRSECINR